MFISCLILFFLRFMQMNPYADPKTCDDLIRKFLDGVEREEQHIRVERKEDASGSSILDGFITTEGLVKIADHFLNDNSRVGHRNRLLALLSFSLCTRFVLCRCSFFLQCSVLGQITPRRFVCLIALC
jgi:hypothetical protein